MATLSFVPTHDALDVELFIAAPPQRVFDAIADPKQVSQWWGAPGLYRTSKWEGEFRVGGKWKSSGVSADGKPFSVEGEYLEIDPPKLLVHTWRHDWNDGPAVNTVVRWEFIPREVHNLHGRGPQKSGTGTLLKVHHSGFAGNLKACEDHGNGWQRVLGWMQAYAERGETIDTRPPEQPK
jgi:uncharacterized protein YndB with AHSA1/START domain